MPPPVRTNVDYRRRRRRKVLLIVAALPLAIGGWVTAAIAVPPVHGPVRPRPVTGPDFDCTLTIPNAPLAALGPTTPYILDAVVGIRFGCNGDDLAPRYLVIVRDPGRARFGPTDPVSSESV